jgi:hypothetical protein
MKLTFWIALLVLASRLAYADGTVLIEVFVDAPASSELGSELRVQVALVNTGKNVVHIPRTYREDGMPAQLRITVVRGNCSLVLVNFRRGKPSTREDVVSLYPAERLMLALPPLNRNVLAQNIWSEEGKAALRVEYATDLEDGRSSGVAHAQEVVVEFRRPDDDFVSLRRQDLQSCINTARSQCEQEVAFFAAVKDMGGADLLVDLLRQRPYLFFVARAIASQRRAVDADALEKLASDATADPVFLRTQADVIRDASNSECVPVERRKQ